jgi:ABC-2 type transport system permease protein
MDILKDTTILLTRHLKKTSREPAWLMIGLMQPVLYLLLYMPLLKNIGSAGLNTGNIAQIFVPGMLVIMAIGMLFAGFGFIQEIRDGLIARWLVTPTSRLSILLSMIFDRLLTLILQAAILLVIAFFLGLRVSWIGMVITMIIVLFIGITMSSLSYVISISTRREDALATITNTIFLPVMLLSGIMLPISLAPDWLKTAALFNPFYYALEACRALFLGDFGNSVIIKGFVFMALFAGVSMWLAVRALRKMSA